MRIPLFFNMLFPNQIWNIANINNQVYITFDDGPIPEITEWVLDVLKEYNIKATFFCIGDNVRKYPKIFEKILADGHGVGNHTFNHLNGWKTPLDRYCENVENCHNEILKHNPIPQKLFRPPYGKIKPSQTKRLLEEGYKIVMWEILSRDYDIHLQKEKCFLNATRKARSGSIIVFHDSLKAKDNLIYALPKTIETLLEKGFTFAKL